MTTAIEFTCEAFSTALELLIHRPGHAPETARAVESGSVVQFRNNLVSATLSLQPMTPRDAHPAVFNSFSLVATPQRDFDGVLELRCSFAPRTEPFFMIPGNLYGTNNILNSKSVQPQLNYRGEIAYPRTPVYYTRADRSSHLTVLSVADSAVVALQIGESTISRESKWFNGLGIDTRGFDGRDSISVFCGHRHFPVRYIGKVPGGRHTRGPEWGCIPFRSGHDMTTEGLLYLGRADTRFAYEGALREIYWSLRDHPGNFVDRQEAGRVLARALVEDAYDGTHHYFPTVLSGAHPDTSTAGDTAWTGGLQVAYPLLRANRFHPQAVDVVIDYVEHLLASGINQESGLFYESKHRDRWRVSGWWAQADSHFSRSLEPLAEVHSAYVNGQACCYLLKAYRYAREAHLDIPNIERWLQTCRSVIAHVYHQQRADGALGAFFDPHGGTAVSYGGFQGAWFLAAGAELCSLSEDEALQARLNSAEEHYFSRLRTLELWGTPLDTGDAVDEEGILAYITAAKTMHESTGRDELLDHLVRALNYEFSWKFAFNTRHVNEPLKSLDWKSAGGSITSSHNIHIHQMGNLIVEELYYAFLKTGDSYLKARLEDTLNWGLGTFNTNGNDFGFGRPGWATEQFFHSDGVQDEATRVGEGGIWPDYLSWAASCVLLSIAANIPDELYSPTPSNTT